MRGQGRGLILTNAYHQSEAAKNQSERLKEEFLKLGVEIDVRPNDFFVANISESGNVVKNLRRKYDFCVYLNKDKYISQMLEKVGIPIFNSHRAIVDCDDKMTTAIVLANHNIKMPTTLAGLLSYNSSDVIAEKTKCYIEKKLGYPLVVKSSFGSLGTGVLLIENRSQFDQIMEKLKNRPHLFQRFVSTSFGKDMRVIVIGGKVVSAIVRQSTNGDFRSNLALGGTATAVNPPKEVVRMCENCARILKLDYCGIDVLFGKDEKEFFICEVNSNAYFLGSEKTTQFKCIFSWQ